MDVAGFLTQAVSYVAGRLGIPDFQLRSASELLKEIALKDPTVSNALSDFALAYEEWYAVTENMLKSGESEMLLHLHVERVKSRDSARAALIAILRAYPSQAKA